jgi:nucleoside-diphosphate-sugar epimerase
MVFVEVLYRAQSFSGESTRLIIIITGLILSSEKISDASAINLGTDERIRVIDAVQETLKYTDHNAEINFLRHMPTGPLNRVVSTKRTKEILGWQPEVRFKEGLHRTIDWYFATKRVEELNRDFESRLIAR